MSFAQCNDHPLFRKITTSDEKDDPCVEAMHTTTEECASRHRTNTPKSCKLNGMSYMKNLISVLIVVLTSY